MPYMVCPGERTDAKETSQIVEIQKEMKQKSDCNKEDSQYDSPNGQPFEPLEHHWAPGNTIIDITTKWAIK